MLGSLRRSRAMGGVLVGRLVVAGLTLVTGACRDSTDGPHAVEGSTRRLTTRSTGSAVLYTRGGTLEISSIAQTWQWAPDRRGVLHGTVTKEVPGTLHFGPQLAPAPAAAEVHQSISTPDAAALNAERAPTLDDMRADGARKGLGVHGYRFIGKDGMMHVVLTTAARTGSGGPSSQTVHFVNGKAISRSQRAYHDVHGHSVATKVVTTYYTPDGKRAAELTIDVSAQDVALAPTGGRRSAFENGIALCKTGLTTAANALTPAPLAAQEIIPSDPNDPNAAGCFSYFVSASAAEASAASLAVQAFVAGNACRDGDPQSCLDAIEFTRQAATQQGIANTFFAAYRDCVLGRIPPPTGDISVDNEGGSGGSGAPPDCEVYIVEVSYDGGSTWSELGSFTVC